jgi:hypothetical protein
MNKSRHYIAILSAFIVLSAANIAAQTAAQWNFNVNTNATTTPANGTASAANWSTGATTFPAGRTTVTTDKSYSTSGFNTPALSAAKYVEFTIAPNTGFAMNLNNVSFYDQKSGTGPSNWVLRSSSDGFVADLNAAATSVPNTVFSTTPSLVVLGTRFQNLDSAITFRLYAYGASSAAGTWRLDDLTIDGSFAAASSAIINASKTAISFATIVAGTPSVSSSFNVSGFGLTGDLILTAPTGYELSTNILINYTSSLILIPINGSIASQTIYVRLTGQNTGVFNGNITLSSPNISTKTIALTGSVVAQPLRENVATVRAKNLGTLVLTGGRVTVATEFGPNQLFIQDNSGGISIYTITKNIAAEYGLQLGDSVEVFGATSIFNGLEQINLLSLTKINTPPAIPVPLVINVVEMAAHEGELVTIQNVSFPGTGGNFAANTNYAFGFAPVRILSTSGSNTLVGSPIQAAKGNITGISGVYNAYNQLYPRFVADLTTTGAAVTDANFEDNTAFDMATWNVEWFGHPTLGPSDNITQYNNVKTVLTTLNADLFEVEEVSDSVSFKALVASLSGYSCACSGEYSFSNAATVDPYGQRVCFVYKNSVFSNVSTAPLLTNFKYDTASVVGYPNAKSRFWASGRLPFMLTANVTINGTTRYLGFVGIHARANTASSPAQDIYDMRKYDVEKLKAFLDVNYPNLPFILSGDFNDDLDETVSFVPTNTSSFINYINDQNNYNLFTLNLSKAYAKSTVGFADMIDHIIGSNELSNAFVTARVGTPQTYISNYGSTTTTDHFPVMAKFNLGNVTIPVELLFFNAQNIDKQTVRLDWATSSEINSAYFDVEKSENGRDFKTIGTVKSAGNSSKKTVYFFDDNNLLFRNKIVYYRLKQVDINGQFKYTKTITFYTDLNKNNALKVFPNPAKNTILIDYLTPIKSINVYNLQGVLIKKLMINSLNNSLFNSTINELNIADFSVGIYLLEVENTEGVLSRIKFVKE